MRLESTETFLRWVASQNPAPEAFLFPSPDEAGCLAAIRLKHTHYRGCELSAKHPLVKVCEENGWLEVREAKSPAPPVKLTEAGRAALDAVVSMRWPVKE